MVGWKYTFTHHPIAPELLSKQFLRAILLTGTDITAQYALNARMMSVCTSCQG